jgi:hypothetical protein
LDCIEAASASYTRQELGEFVVHEKSVVAKLLGTKEPFLEQIAPRSRNSASYC